MIVILCVKALLGSVSHDSVKIPCNIPVAIEI